MKTYFILCLFFLTAGCLGGVSAPSTFYTFTPQKKAPAISTKSFQISVDRPTIPPTLDRPQIIFTPADSAQVSVSELHRWIAAVDRLFQQTLINDLNLYLPQSVVKTKGSLREKTPLNVFVQINRFSGALNQKIVLDAVWGLIDENGKVLFQTRTQLEESAGHNYDEFAAAHSQLIAQLAKQIAQQIIRQKP